jgi:predicted short-subunit dehydrogenase-like oxidoreductase (DUF2520 family)
MIVFPVDLAALRLAFVGAGRLGTALAWGLAQRGCPVVSVASRNRAAAEQLAQRIPSCRVASIQDVVEAADLVFVTTPDSAIASTAAAARWRQGMGVVHCSGATEVSALASAAADGALVGGFHPLQTFGDPQAAMNSLAGCTITIEADEPLNGALVALAARLECRVNRLPPGARGRYHAAAGYASQFINVLLREASAIWQSWGASEDAAVRALLPLVRGTLSSIGEVGLARAMPGPVSRGDVESVAKHVAALRDLGPQPLASYRLLCERSIALALERKGIDEATAERIRVVLAARDHSAVAGDRR